ncbi:DUF1262 family protein (DUF1262) [Rhynchospora pubera]|uniref:DUF1262 family protein (DUF1262) n=1 Tax=Rhynchospora pubera TaxID=906938 RepID=A0AAV8H542_9POAL|nr:DUF1262 family protein (DUF1262) [Rhynchospora pubera]
MLQSTFQSLRPRERLHCNRRLSPEGPNSGYVVVKEDDPHEETGTRCWRLCCQRRTKELPFPQNKIFTVYFNIPVGQAVATQTETVLFVPVMNLPLPANRYYVVVAEGKYKGQVHTCSRKQDMTTCCFCRCITDVKPKPFDHRDIYQQIEIIPHKGQFIAKSVASDGFVPWIFRQKYWELYEEKSKNCHLGDAFGINNAVRSNFLNLDIAINAIAGKWYCPFIFVKESGELKDQMKKTTFYEVILEQFWREAHSGIEKKRILLRGNETMKEEMESSDGFVWFKRTGDFNSERIGLSFALWERIKWEENRNGWDEGIGSLKDEVKFGGFVFVERFSFKRLDGSLALALEFIHTDKLRTG